MPSKPAIVISPGGGHLSSAYHKLTTYLTTHGHPVTAVDLISNTVTTNPSAAAAHSSTFAGDVAAVTAAITSHADSGRDVVLLCHWQVSPQLTTPAFGGIPGSTACANLLKTTRTAHNLPGGVTHVIYLASFALPLGASLFGLSGGALPPIFNVSPDDKLLTPKNARDLFWEDGMSDADYTELERNIAPMAKEAFEGQVGFEAWRHVDASYIVTLGDNSLHTEMQRGMIAQCDAVLEGDGKGKKMNVVELEGGHEPFVTRPENLGEVIEKILGEGV